MKREKTKRNIKLNWKFTIVIITAITIPIAIFAGVLFYNLEQNAVEENKKYMEYKMDKNAEITRTCIDSVNMSTQFFLSDEGMLEVLLKTAQGQQMTTQELVEFQTSDVQDLERLVSNNPLLYVVRIFSSEDQVQEMMPILYRRDRMQRLAWADEMETQGSDGGWHFGYTDQVFSSLISNQGEALAGYITPVMDYEEGCLGYIEAAVTMRDLIPGLYETGEQEWGVFFAQDGQTFYGDNRVNAEGEPEEELYEWLQTRWEQPDKEWVDYVRLGKRNLIVTSQKNGELGGILVGVKDITGEIQAVYHERSVFIGVMLVLLTGVVFIVNMIVQHMLRQFYAILRSMRKVESGNLSVRITRLSNDEMGELGVQLNRMLDRIQEIMQENIDREVLVKNSEIRALQNQINAHFIYNVLESIKMMAEIDEEYAISDAITSLGRLLRYSMKWHSKNVALQDELEYIRNYMALINLRNDYAIQLSLKIPEELYTQEIPKMSLQPVVENSILHGIDPLGEDNTIYIKAWAEENDCVIEISDAGQGMTDEELKLITDRLHGRVEPSGGKGGIGLKNVQDRIVLGFGKKYGLTVYSKKGCYTKVRIRIPLNQEKEAKDAGAEGSQG